jgi:tetratricopeptide (TPR) repeat protein
MDEAVACHRQALASCRNIGYHYGEAGALNALGLDYQYLSRLAEAIACHDQALALNRAIGNDYQVAESL